MPPPQSKLLELTVPFTDPLLLHAPAYVAAGTTKFAVCAHDTGAIVGHVNVAGPDPVTVAVHVVLSGLLH